jgi:hypothetical protein
MEGDPEVSMADGYPVKRTRNRSGTESRRFKRL